jgi:hypothetical protein
MTKNKIKQIKQNFNSLIQNQILSHRTHSTHINFMTMHLKSQIHLKQNLRIDKLSLK